MILFEDRRLSFAVSLVQPVELKFWDDMNISTLFGTITVYFSLKFINCSFNMSISYSLSPLAPVL